MLKKLLSSPVIVILGLCVGGCDSAAQQPRGYDYPAAPPIWIVEYDPDVTVFERKDLERDRKTAKMLVIPLYKDYRHKGGIDDLAIAHPFVYQQGDDIEKQLASFGQRENLRRLIFWVPGYFPNGLGRTSPWVPVISGKKMIVLELQPCLQSEESHINSAMKTLLLDRDFVIEKMLAWKVRLPYSNEPTQVKEPYDFTRLVRSEIFEGRFFKYGTTKDYVLWAFKPGTRIINRLSAEEKKAVANFAAPLERKRAEQSSGNGKNPHK
jgi:hypothetical protein